MKTEKASSEFNTQDKKSSDSRKECKTPEKAAHKATGIVEVFVSPANVLTSMRIAFSGVMLLLKPLSPTFYCVYALAGLTDILDGAVARKTGTESRAGEVMDSAADLVFAAAALVCLLPIYKEEIPFWLWAAVAFVIYLKIKNTIAVFVMQRRLVKGYTFLNKITLLAVFLLPFVCNRVPIAVYGGICAGLALAATAEAFILSIQDSTKSGK